MTSLLNLLSAVALLVWGTYLVRTGVLEVCGAGLRDVLARSLRNRASAALAGLGVTAFVQSSTATALIVSAFVGQGIVALPTALAVMLGADVGTSLMALVFSMDLSWMSPALIFAGVVLFISRPTTRSGRTGRVLIGLGLMLLALRLVSESASVMVASSVVRTLLASLHGDLMLVVTVGALLTVLAHSSLAVVLLTAALAATGSVHLPVGLGLVLGANLGSGILGVLVTAKASRQARQVPLGNLLFKCGGVMVAAPAVTQWSHYGLQWAGSPGAAVVTFHLALNMIAAVAFLGLTVKVAKLVGVALPVEADEKRAGTRPHHLDPSALATPSLAIACAAREALHQADVVETMLRGVLRVIQTDDLRLAEELRQLDDTVDELNSAIKYYLTRVSRETLSESESRKWTDILTFTINLEQIGDTAERILQDVEDKKIRKGRSFSPAGLAEIAELHALLVSNLHLAMSVFLTGSSRDAQKLIEEKGKFRDLERAYATSHLIRLSQQTVSSIETSSLHLDLISDMQRINSHICSIAYAFLRGPAQAGPHLPLEAAVDS